MASALELDEKTGEKAAKNEIVEHELRKNFAGKESFKLALSQKKVLTSLLDFSK
jgi:hypothetical protein